jgi:conjugative transposon TraM protein
MEKLKHSQAFLRKRKMMLIMPVIVLPFITMAFWALGGGKDAKANITVNQKGLNLNLPDAKLKDENLNDKLSFYDKADKDSAKMEEWMKTDSYYKQKIDTGFIPGNELEILSQASASKYNQHLNTSPYQQTANNPEQKLMEKLALLQQQLNKQPDEQTENSAKQNFENSNSNEFSSEVNRLENMMQTMNTGNGEDPEMKQLNGTLEKILDIQHPQRIKEKLQAKSEKQKENVFPISTQSQTASISLLDTGKDKIISSDGFYGLQERSSLIFQNTSAEATVYGNQTLQNGAVLQLRLATDIFVNGLLIPKGNPVNGIANLNNERLEIEINTIRYGNTLLPVKLEVYDMDGLLGIYIPSSISRDVTKQSADNTLQLMELSSVDPSMKAQLAAAGVNTVKSLLSKKVKQIKVMVKTGYRVLLRDKNSNSVF